MARWKKVLAAVLGGGSDANIRFDDLRTLLLRFDFEERVSGSHHVFVRPEVEEIINLQKDGNQAKPYQVRQVRSVFTRYGLGG